MLCEICKRQYAMMTRNVDRGFGEIKVAVCHDCANEIDAREQNLDFTNDFWGDDTRKITKCGVCGTTLDSILQTGYVGCSTCYKIFSKEVSQLVNNIQGKNVHVGKVPLTITNKRDMETDVSGMMDKAIEFGDLGLADIVRNHFPGKRR